jgi:ribosome biogenesis GTPase
MEEYRIIKALSGFYYVQTEDGVVECRARGRFRRQDQSPLVGDFVRITRQGDKGVLEALLPRKNAFIRPAVANIDQLVVLASCAIPVTEPFLIDRVLAIAQLQNVPALVVVNKDDLAPAQPLAEIYRRAGVPVLVTSAETGEGIEALREALAGKLSCLTGNSGVGKSSLLNRACPQLQLPVGEVSEKLGRGRHTTRHVELFALGGGTYVIDTPGFSSFDTEEMDLELKAHLPETFPEFAPYVDQCRFTGCTHTKEKGCRVLQAVQDGDIPASRHRSYLRLYDELKDLRAWQKK